MSVTGKDSEPDTQRGKEPKDEGDAPKLVPISQSNTATVISPLMEQMLQQMLQQNKTQQEWQERQQERLERLERQMARTLELTQQQMREQSQQQMREQRQYLQELLAAERVQPAVKTSNTAADTLPTPIATFRRARPNSRRLTFGLATQMESPTTPLTGLNAAAEDETSTGPAETTTSEEAKPATLQQALAMIKGLVAPFYADSVKDKDSTVVDFVEKVESAMSEIIPDQPQMRITLVRLHCRDGAMRWMNDKIKELTKAGHHSIDWDRDVRRAFIEAHLGTDTVELWLAKLGTLRLGKGNTPTPIELESQFDNIARHVYPAHAAGEAGVDLLLTTQYGNIIAASNKEMFKNIVRTQPHANLRQWKTAVAIQWNAEAQIRAMMAEQDRAANGPWRGGGWRGRGGRGGGASGPPAHAVSAAAMDVGEQGEEYTTEGVPDQQLAAVGSGSGGRGGGQGGGRGGGRGGRGGRGGGGAGQPARYDYSPELIKKLTEEKKCFNCGQGGHTSRGCLNTRVDLSKE